MAIKFSPVQQAEIGPVVERADVGGLIEETQAMVESIFDSSTDLQDEFLPPELSSAIGTILAQLGESHDPSVDQTFSFKVVEKDGETVSYFQGPVLCATAGGTCAIRWGEKFIRLDPQKKISDDGFTLLPNLTGGATLFLDSKGHCFPVRALAKKDLAPNLFLRVETFGQLSELLLDRTPVTNLRNVAEGTAFAVLSVESLVSSKGSPYEILSCQLKDGTDFKAYSFIPSSSKDAVLFPFEAVVGADSKCVLASFPDGNSVEFKLGLPFTFKPLKALEEGQSYKVTGITLIPGDPAAAEAWKKADKWQMTVIDHLDGDAVLRVDQNKAIGMALNLLENPDVVTESEPGTLTIISKTEKNSKTYVNARFLHPVLTSAPKPGFAALAAKAKSAAAGTATATTNKSARVAVPAATASGSKIVI